MFRISLLILFFILTPSFAQDKLKAKVRLNEFVEKLKKGTEPTLVSFETGYKNQKYIAGKYKVYGPFESDYAEKPFIARINWLSTVQETKIYSSPERIEDKWEIPGKLVGTGLKEPAIMHSAIIFYEDGEWKVHSMAHYESFERIFVRILNDDNPWLKSLGK